MSTLFTKIAAAKPTSSTFSASWTPRFHPRWSAFMRLWTSLSMHHCHDVLLFIVQYERWEFVYQPKYVAYLNLIEPRPGKRCVPWP